LSHWFGIASRGRSQSLIRATISALLEAYFAFSNASTIAGSLLAEA
jgi:hypothetical protein